MSDNNEPAQSGALPSVPLQPVVRHPHCGVWCCEKHSQCKWQGFALHRGLAWGTIADSLPEWRERHERECGGKLIQLLEPNPTADRRATAQEGTHE